MLSTEDLHAFASAPLSSLPLSSADRFAVEVPSSTLGVPPAPPARGRGLSPPPGAPSPPAPRGRSRREGDWSAFVQDHNGSSAQHLRCALNLGLAELLRVAAAMEL